MAITNAGTKNSLNSGQLPTGYTPPVVTDFEDQESIAPLTLTIAKSVVENVSNAVTMANIITELNTQIDAILAADYIASQTVDAFGDLVKLTINYSSGSGNADWLGTTVPTYTCKVNLYVKTA